MSFSKDDFYDGDYVEWSNYMKEYYAALEQQERDLQKKQNDASKSKRMSWDEMLMSIAEIVARRSEDPKHKVGAVISKEHHVIGIGYNAGPKCFSYAFNWNSDEKYKYVIHAEMNAIMNASSMGIDVRGSDIYVTLSPCPECMKLLIQFEIKNVYYEETYEKTIKQSEFIAEHSDINLIKISKGE